MTEEKSYFIVNPLSDKAYINEILKNELNKTSKVLQEMVDILNSPNFERFTQKQLYYINKNFNNFQYCRSFCNNNAHKFQCLKKIEFRNFMISLDNQFEENKFLSEKQIDVLRNFKLNQTL